MLKKTITFVDYNGEERTEDFYFNLSKAELMEMQLSTTGGFLELLKKIIASKNTPELVKLFKTIILKAYGEKSDDGRRFIKSEELSNEFSQTEAYSSLYVELATNDVEASNFINGIIPADLVDQAQEMIKNGDVDEDTKKILGTITTDDKSE